MLTFAFSSLNHSPVPRSLSILFFLEYPLSNCLIFFFSVTFPFKKKLRYCQEDHIQAYFNWTLKKN